MFCVWACSGSRMSGTAALAALSQNSSEASKPAVATAHTALASSWALKSPSGKRRMHSSDQASNIVREASAQATSSGSLVLGTPAAPVPSLFAKAQATCVDADE